MIAKRLVVAAAILVAVYGLLEALGARGTTSALSGSAHGATLVVAVFYLFAYFSALLVAPPLVITAVALRMLAPRKRECERANCP
ncbi:hypothetical protein BH09MYX1_BH09MYX1_24330 [soil metagenome]